MYRLLDQMGITADNLAPMVPMAPIPASGVDLGQIVGVATLGDRLALTISSTSLMSVDRAESGRAATAFLSAGVKRLELAVGQEVTFEAA